MTAAQAALISDKLTGIIIGIYLIFGLMLGFIWRRK